MIYTLTLNPAIDYRMDVKNVIYSETNRSQSEQISFGGKGINVSKVLKNLGVESVALGFCAGFTGDALLAHLDECGIKNDFIKLSKGTTRINLKLFDQICETEINAAGPEVSENEKAMLFDKINNTVTYGDTVILSGSTPVGTDSGIYSDIMKMLSDKNVIFVVDATGELLKKSLVHKPFLVKPNKSELCALLGKMLEGEEEIINGAIRLRDEGAKNVLVSMGSEGAILVDESGNVHKIAAHKIDVVGTVGAGDSMVAGFVAGIEKGAEFALALANACGGATASMTGLATKQAVEKLMGRLYSLL